MQGVLKILLSVHAFTQGHYKWTLHMMSVRRGFTSPYACEDQSLIHLCLESGLPFKPCWGPDVSFTNGSFSQQSAVCSGPLPQAAPLSLRPTKHDSLSLYIWSPSTIIPTLGTYPCSKTPSLPPPSAKMFRYQSHSQVLQIWGRRSHPPACWNPMQGASSPPINDRFRGAHSHS